MKTSAVTSTSNLVTRSRHVSGISFTGPLVASLVALALAGLVVAIGLSSVLSSVLAGSIHEDQPHEVIDQLVARSKQQSTDYQGRFNGRYIFFKPPPPPPPRREAVREPDPVPVVEPPKPAGPPPIYQGPGIAWVIGEDVYFNMVTPTITEKYMRIRLGEERSGIKVLNLDKMPRTVRVGHMGGEYDVKVFGESTASASLFPTAPKASILVPGFIEQTPAPTLSEPEVGAAPPPPDQNESALTGDSGGDGRRGDRARRGRDRPPPTDDKPEEELAEEDGKEEQSEETVEEVPERRT